MPAFALLAAAIVTAISAPPADAAGYHPKTDACALARDAVVANVLHVPVARVKVVRRANALEDGFVLCEASSPNGSTVTVGVADTTSLREAVTYRRRACDNPRCDARYAALLGRITGARDFVCDALVRVRNLGIETDDGTPVPHLGDRSFASSVLGIYVLRGQTELRVVTNRAASRSSQLDAEGVVMDERPDSVRVAVALVTRLPAGAKASAPHDCRPGDVLDPPNS
jgi:hypothetical protein